MRMFSMLRMVDDINGTVLPADVQQTSLIVFKEKRRRKPAIRIIRFSENCEGSLNWMQNYTALLFSVLGIQLLNIERKRMERDFCTNVLWASAQKSPASPILLEHANCTF